MAEAPKTSFIPKQMTGRVAGRAPKHRRNLNIFNILAALIFLASLVLSVGVYVYKGYNEQRLASAKNDLSSIKGSFGQGQIESIRELDRRIQAAEAIVNQHLAPSLIFDMLELRTQQDIQFNGFLFARNESGSVDVELNGNAVRFNSVALQADQFRDSQILATAIFSDINVTSGPESTEDVTFTVIANTGGQLIAYQVGPSAPSAPAAPLEEAADDETVDETVPTAEEGDEPLEGIDDILNATSTPN